MEPVFDVDGEDALGNAVGGVRRSIRPGRTLTVCLAEVFGVEGGQSTLIATMLSTIILRPVSE